MTPQDLLTPLQLGSLTLPNRIVMAPLAGYNNAPFRLQTRRYGDPAFVATEMISAKSLSMARERNAWYLERSPEEGIVQYQIWGTDPELIANAARLCQDAGADLIDINCGCPVRKVIASGSGAAFMRDPAGIGACLTAMRQAVACPISAKIRIGYDGEHWNGLEVARIVEDAGADFLTVHGRHGKESYSTPVRLEPIAEIVEALSIPVFGNGDVLDGSSAARMVEKTGCAGVMVARACMGNPWVFDKIRSQLAGQPWTGPSQEERGRVLLDNYHLLLPRMGEDAATRHVRKLACFYSKGITGSREFRQEVSHTKTAADFEDLIHRHFFAQR